MSRILEKYAKHFDPGGTRRQAQAEAIRKIQQAAPVLKELKERLQARVKEKGWAPGMTNEQAASNLIAQTIYQEIMSEIDTMVHSATEV